MIYIFLYQLKHHFIFFIEKYEYLCHEYLINLKDINHIKI